LNPDPFGALGLPARPGLTDDDVRAAWRRVAAATHPDRADGGDPGRFAEAAAAYTELRTRYGRGEAYADLAAGTRRRSPASTRQRSPAGTRQRSPAGTRQDSPAGTQDTPPAAPGGQPGAAAPGGQPGRAPAPKRAGPARVLVTRIGRGRPAVFGLRLAITAGVIAVAFLVTGAQPAAAGLATGAVTWLLLTGRHDLAPPIPPRPGGTPRRGRQARHQH
jgi:hypothetical protein